MTIDNMETTVTTGTLQNDICFSIADALNENRSHRDPASDDYFDMADEFAAMATSEDDDEGDAHEVAELHCPETLSNMPFEEFMDSVKAFSMPSAIPHYARIAPRPRIWTIITKDPHFGYTWVAYPSSVIKETLLSTETQCPLPRDMPDQTARKHSVALHEVLTDMVVTKDKFSRSLIVGTWWRALFPNPAHLHNYTREIVEFAGGCCPLLEMRGGDICAAVHLAWLRARDGRATVGDHRHICDGYRHRYLREMKATHMLYRAVGFGILDHYVWDQPNNLHDRFDVDAVLSISVAVE